MKNNNLFKHYSAKSLKAFPQIIPKKKTIELIKEYLLSQPEQIKKLQKISLDLYDTINNFIEITENYNAQIVTLALKIIPTYTTEGKLLQAVQGILLFYSENLDNLIKELKNENTSTKEEEINDILNKFNDYKSSYFNKMKQAILYSEKYKKDIVEYQEFLVNEEYKKHMNKGDMKNYDDDIINISEIDNKIKDKKEKETNFEEEYSIIDNNYNDKINLWKENNDINNKNNEKEVIESQKLFLSNINESNDILNNIKEFLAKEKTILRKNIFNICDCLIEGLVKFADSQKNHYNIQNDVIKKLTNEIKFEEKDKNIIRPAIIKLKYLEIYKNFIKEKSEININNNSNDSNNDSNDSYNDLKTLKKITTKRKSLDLDDKKTNIFDFINNRNTVNIPHNFDIQKIDEHEEIFKGMVTKLNRSEIINIFEKIKSTKIVLAESDTKLIEQEIIYKKIHEILVYVFFKTEKYTEKEKNILLNYFEKDKSYIFYFIKVLNDHRTKGNFILSKQTLEYLGEIFQYINNLVLSENDMELFKFVFILSMTYYHVSEKDKMKIYLFSYIKDHPDYQKVKFWEDYLKELVEHDLNGNTFGTDFDLKNKKWENLKKEEKEKLNNCYFSNFLTIVKAMADFRLDKKFVRDFVEKNKEKYILSKAQIENVCMIFDISLKENEINYIGDYIDKEKDDKQINVENKDIEKKKEEDKENNDEKKDNIIEDINQNKKEITEDNKNNENILDKDLSKNQNNENYLEKNENEKNNDEKNPEKEKNSNNGEKISDKNINEKKGNLQDNTECENENNQTNKTI